MVCVSRPSSERLSASTTGGTVYTKGGYSIETNTQEATYILYWMAGGGGGMAATYTYNVVDSITITVYSMVAVKKGQ